METLKATGITAFILLLIIIKIRNSLIFQRNEVLHAFSGVDIQLKKRFDLIPNLVAVVQQHMQHEQELLAQITQIKTKALNSKISDNQKVALDNQLSGHIDALLASAHNTPHLKTNAGFVQLQRSINEAEAQISAARRTYNASITEYNNAVQSFPNNIMAGMMGLRSKEIFHISPAERQNVNIQKLF